MSSNDTSLQFVVTNGDIFTCTHGDMFGATVLYLADIPAMLAQKGNR